MNKIIVVLWRERGIVRFQKYYATGIVAVDKLAARSGKWTAEGVLVLMIRVERKSVLKSKFHR
ncbi:hypothetical protein VCHA30O60_60050 [Vibrio chagasii]|nr:hypothetical protein VCHA36P164_120110 [Vibrio chagasii]CAH6991502.1 hypothetical protein VCHA30O60_60050 [Vibrio chagasii]CAH7041686.1 hypothetical protein VCHA40P242_10593 [Vibrio chagasii]